MKQGEFLPQAPALLASAPQVRPTGDCGPNSTIARQSLRFSARHQRNSTGEPHVNERISGAAVSIRYLEGVVQGGQSPSVSG